MMKKETSPIPIICNSRGWVLVYVLVFCIVIQAIALLSAGIITHNIRSGSVFSSLLSRRHASPDARPALKTTLYGAPEGWDHACFLTEVTERSWESQSSFTWRARLGEQPYQTVEDRSLASWRPYLILLVDDSKGMLASSGYAYDKDRIYLERTSGDITPSRERDDITNILATSEGTFFRGSYGNISRQAVDTYHFGGVMQCWTRAISGLIDLVEDMDLCPIAIATVSKGIIQPFTTDRKALITALEALRPQAEDARLAQACLDLTARFPDKCGTSRHIVIATAGVALKDGNIPSGIQDFDHDHNSLDKAVDEGSHCLDDVAAYAASKDIHVHTVGPDTSFLRSVASKGNGAFMPTKAAFKPPASFICQAPFAYGAVHRFPVNADLAFNPTWLVMDGASCLRLMANTPLHLASSERFMPRGVSPALHAAGQVLFCTTSRDDLLSLDIATGSCLWVVHGPGGRVSVQDGTIVAGPNLDGDIMGLGGVPAIRWVLKGDLFALAPGVAYIARGSSISACSLSDGAVVGGIELGSPVRRLGYDPTQGCVVASSGTDLIYILSKDLKIQSLLNPDLPAPLDIIRTFHLRRELCVVATAQNSVACLKDGKILWKISLGSGTCTSALAMDGKLYLATWSPGECGGMDSGSSTLQVLDLKTGEKVSDRPLFSSLSFGPLVDLDAGVISYASPGMEQVQVDISGLTGMKPCPLGTRLK
jgi:hypothetical protein